MALAVPKTSEVRDLIVSGLESSLSTTIPLLPKAFSRVLAAVLAGAILLVYKYAGSIFLNLFVRYASTEPTTINGKVVIPLVEWGRLVGVGDPEPADRAEHTITITVTNQTGSLALNAQLIHPATQVIYLTLATVTLNAATKTVTVRASSDPAGNGGAGAVGNLPVGTVLEFANPLPNVAREATITTAQTVAGKDAETWPNYRLRILKRFQRPPQGGAYADYQVWGEEVTGVVNVYPYASDLPGHVECYVEADTNTDPDGIPTLAQREDVYDAIQMDVAGVPTRRPVSAAVKVLEITRLTFSANIFGMLVDDEDETKADIEEGLVEYALSREPFIVGLTSLPRRDRITQAEVAGIVTNVVNAHGGTVTRVEATFSGVPQFARNLQKGQKAKFAGPPTYF